MSTYNRFYAEALRDGTPLTDPSILRAVWVHRDGRCLGMTGMSKHVMEVVPAEFVRAYCPYDDDVDIYVPLSGRCQPHRNYRPQTFDAPR